MKRLPLVMVVFLINKLAMFMFINMLEVNQRFNLNLK